MMNVTHNGPLRNITAEVDHHHNNSLLRNSAAAKPMMSAATGPVYAPVYGPVNPMVGVAAGQNTAAAPHAMLLQRNNSSSIIRNTATATPTPATIAPTVAATGAAPNTTRLNPSAAEFGGLIGATASKPARRVTLLRSSAPATTAPTAAPVVNTTTTTSAAKAQQDMALFQQMQQQQMAYLVQQQHMLAAAAAAHPDTCQCTGCYTAQQQRMLAQQQQLFFGGMPNDSISVLETTRPQTPEMAESQKENNAPSTPLPAVNSFVSPAKPRATLYRPVARNFFVTPIKESTAARGDQYLNNAHHQDPNVKAATDPHSTPAGKGKRNNNATVTSKAIPARESFGIGERNTPKASEKVAQQQPSNKTLNKANKGPSNASRKLLIGDDDDQAAPIQRQNTNEPAQVKNITSFFTASPQGRKAAATATVHAPPPPMPPVASTHTTFVANTPVRVPMTNSSTTPMLQPSTNFNQNGGRHSAHSSASKMTNNGNYYVEMEGLLGQRTYALTRAGDIAPIGAHVLFEGDRGEDMGRVISVSSQPPTAADLSAAKASGASPPQHHSGNSPMNSTAMLSPEAAAAPMIPNAVVIRQASPEEISYWRNDLVAEAEDAVNKCSDCIYRHNLNLIIVNAVFQFDRKKLTFYYETEQPRVDFRKMLAELYNEFHCRIWMERVE